MVYMFSQVMLAIVSLFVPSGESWGLNLVKLGCKCLYRPSGF